MPHYFQVQRYKFFFNLQSTSKQNRVNYYRQKVETDQLRQFSHTIQKQKIFIINYLQTKKEVIALKKNGNNYLIFFPDFE